MTFDQWYTEATNQLVPIYGAREAKATLRILIEDLPIDQHRFDPEVLHRANLALDRVLSDEPVQYVCGQAYFYDSLLKVGPGVLIPRPETEELVDSVIKAYKNSNRPFRILDIGTGSGCIALMLKKHLPMADVVGIDASEAALAIARDNVSRLRLDVRLEQVDFLNAGQWHTLGGPWDIIVSNPPYIPASESRQVGRSCLKFEPRQALFTSDDDGMEFYAAIARFGQQWLALDGEIFLELNEFRAIPAEQTYVKNGYNTVVIPDLSGKDRILRCRKG